MTVTQAEANRTYRATDAGRQARIERHKRYRRTPGGKAAAARRKGPSAEYQRAHNLLRDLLGKASEYRCHDCDRQAAEWAFDEPTGFSFDLLRYLPKCRSCHKIQDMKADPIDPASL